MDVQSNKEDLSLGFTRCSFALISITLSSFKVKQVVLLSIMPGYPMKRYMFTIVKQVVLL